MSSDEDNDSDDEHHHENDVFIFQSPEETVIFIRKNPKSVEQILYKDNIMHESYLNNNMFNEHVRYYIRNEKFQEIEPLSTNGKIWLRRLYAKFNSRMDKTMANIILNFLNTLPSTSIEESDYEMTRVDRVRCVML